MDETIMIFSAALLLCSAAANVVYAAPQQLGAIQLAGTSCCGAPIYILAGCPRVYNSTVNNNAQSEDCSASDETNEDQREESYMFHDLKCSSRDPVSNTNNNSIENTDNIFSNHTVSNDTASDGGITNISKETSKMPIIPSDKNVTKPDENGDTRRCCPIYTCRLNCTDSTCRSVQRTRCCSHSPNALSLMAASGNGCGDNNLDSRLSRGNRPCLLCNSGNGLGGNNITSNINFIKGGNLLCCSGNGPGSNRIQSFINVISGDSSLVSSGDITLLQSLCNLFIGQNCSLYSGPAFSEENPVPPTNASAAVHQQSSVTNGTEAKNGSE